ncbi:MAG: ABC transporter ATP-binding protein [Candidatus Micrarchaeota archaeon]|nr:ABC transporter ATP-binding protein [Candidatus Micrarchaeota archaeon]
MEEVCGECMISVRNVVKAFGEKIALNRVSFSSTKGINIILGPNGAGKSTLLRCIDGLYRVDSGEVRVLGSDPYANDGLKSRLSLLSDNYALYDALSVTDNLRFFGRLYGLSDVETLSRSKEVLDELKATEFLNSKVETLSRGTKQKIAFCRAVISRPDVLLLDEPTAFLDAFAAESVRRILLGYAEEGKTILFVTQKLDEVTRFNGRISVISAGKIVRNTTTSGLYSTILKNTKINVRLARPMSTDVAMRIGGFVGADQGNATMLTFKIDSYRDINKIVMQIAKNRGYVVGIDLLEPMLAGLSV